MKLNIIDKFKPLLYPKRYKVFYGGRGGGKTHSFGQILIVKSCEKKLTIVCARQFQNSIADSVKSKLEQIIVELGLQDEFYITETRIYNKFTGSVFKFKGLDRNILSVKGWEDVDIVWIEEASTVKIYVLEILFPTIRKPGSEIWMSFNRGSRTDPIDQMFFGANVSKVILAQAVIVKVNWYDNPYFTQELEIERQRCLEQTPERYPHIWEGEPDDVGGQTKVLPYAKLLKCVDAHKILGYIPPGVGNAGLDPADSESAGADTNAWSCRYGSLLKDTREWKVKYLHMTAARADRLNAQYNIADMHYDIGGLGAGIKSDLSRVPTDPGSGIGPAPKKFIPFNFGSGVVKPRVYYIRHSKLKIRNSDFFAKANAQAWWNIKLRVENTIKALDGGAVDLSYCFFIDGGIQDLDGLLAELNQCTYDDAGGKIKIDKAPDGQRSPNRADSVVLAFAGDLQKGLKAV